MLGLMRKEKSGVNDEQCQTVPMPYHVLSADRRLQRRLDPATISGPTRDDDRLQWRMQMLLRLKGSQLNVSYNTRRSAWTMFVSSSRVYRTVP